MKIRSSFLLRLQSKGNSPIRINVNIAPWLQMNYYVIKNWVHGSKWFHI